MKKPDTEEKLRVTLYDWSLVLYPDIYNYVENPKNVFAKHNAGHAVALFGKAINDPRFNAGSGAFADGHRLISSPVISITDYEFHTATTVYDLRKETINADYKIWSQEKHYSQAISLLNSNDKSQNNPTLLHICEVCGKQEILSSDEAFAKGWDYPPRMCPYTIIAPRTCGGCGLMKTLWWEIAVNNTSVDCLDEHLRATLKRILAEPFSIVPK